MFSKSLLFLSKNVRNLQSCSTSLNTGIAVAITGHVALTLGASLDIIFSKTIDTNTTVYHSDLFGDFVVTRINVYDLIL